MRRMFTAFLLLAAFFLAAPGAASAQIGAPSSWFAPPALPYTVLGHADGSIWVGTTSGVHRYSRAGVNLGTVANVDCAALASCPNGDVVLMAYTNRAIMRYTAAGQFVRSWNLQNVGASGGDLVTDENDNVYVLYWHDGPNYRLPWIRKFDATGNLLAETGPLNVANGITRVGNTLFVAELYTNSILEFDLNLQPAGSIALYSQYAHYLEADNAGNLLITDYYTKTLRRLTTSGTVLETVINGWPGWPGYYAYWNPFGISQAPDGLYVVADGEHGYVLLFNELATPARTTTWGAIKAAPR